MRFIRLLPFALTAVPSSAFGVPSGTPSWPGPRHPVPTTLPGTYETPDYTWLQLYNLTTNFFDNFIYPLNAVQSESINSTLFAENVLGRVDVTRDFNGRELNTEYAFGLFSTIATNPKSFTLLGIPTKYTVTHFAANQNIVSVALIIDFNITALGVISPVEVDFWGTFNADGGLSQYDATFRYLQWQFDWLFGIGEKVLGVNSTAAVQAEVTKLLANSICETEVEYCLGDNVQFSNFTQCFEFLTESVRFGSAFELGMNTLLCRMVHQSMVPLQPGLHCPHIGPTGGGYCTDDRTYVGAIQEPLYTNTPFVPYGFQNSNATVAAERK